MWPKMRMTLPSDEPSTAEIVGEFPQTPAQARFWFLEQLNPGSVANNIAVQWELRGRFQTESVEAAFRRVVARHEVLRTRFVERGGAPRQEVLADAPFRLGHIDVRGLPEAERMERVAQIARDMAVEPFDLGRPSHLRAMMVRLGPDRARLLIGAHHIVFDGWSIRVLGREVGAAIAELEGGPTAELPELELQYADYALWQEEMLSSAEATAALDWWRDTLSDAAYFELPSDRPRAPLGARIGARLDLPMEAGFGEALARAAKLAGMSPFAYGAAVVAAALHRFTHSGDVSFAAAHAGRDASELQDLIGTFVNPFVLRWTLRSEMSLTEVLTQSKADVQEATGRGDVPFDHVVRALRRPRDAARTPLASVQFGLGSVFLEEQSYGPVEIRSIPSPTPEISHDLNIQITGRQSGWLLMLDYDVARFEQATLEALAEVIREAFQVAFTAPDTKLGALALPTRKVPAVTRAEAAEPAGPEPTRAPAEGNTVSALASIWSDLLGVPEASCDGDFFELGGHSILVLRMMVQVEERFGVRPDLQSFLADPTLAGVARAIEAQSTAADILSGAEDWSLLRLRDGSDTVPLLVTVNQPFLYHALARKLGMEAGVVNLHVTRPEALGAGQPKDVASLVSEGAEIVRAEARGRPVILLGQCIDGLMGLHIAAALSAEGEPPASVALVDTWAPWAGRDVAPSVQRRRRRRSKLRRLRQYAVMKLRGEIGWGEYFGSIGPLRRALVALGRVPAETADEAREWAINARLQEAVRPVEFAPYSGDVILFCTASQPPRARTDRFDWGAHLPADAAQFDLPGWHEDALLKHGIDRIADVLEARMARL